MVKFEPRKASQGLAFETQFQRLSALVFDMAEIRRGASVEDLADDAPLLDRWVLGERPARCLIGLSTGHPVLEGTGRMITTSDLFLISEDAAWARTLSRWYRLGEPFAPGGPNSGGMWSWQ